MATLSGRRSPSDAARPKRQPIAEIRIVRKRPPIDDRTYDPNSQKLEDTKSGYISGDRDGNFQVAVDLRATQPDRNGNQSLRFGSYGNVRQWMTELAIQILIN